MTPQYLTQKQSNSRYRKVLLDRFGFNKIG